MRLPRYRLGARFYDVLSLERPLYRRGRLAALALVDPRPGERVLDVGCGTGLSFAPTLAAIGEHGHLVGQDASAAMLRGAAARVRRHDWRQVQLLTGDARHLPTGSFDVILFCYSLSIVTDWPRVWAEAMTRLAPGGRVAVLDTALPTGRARVFAPAAWALMTAGGVRPRRQVWTAVERELTHVRSCSMLGGHLRLSVGTQPG